MKNKVFFPALTSWVCLLLMVAILLAALNTEDVNGQPVNPKEAVDMPGVLDEFRVLLGEGTTAISPPPGKWFLSTTGADHHSPSLM